MIECDNYFGGLSIEEYERQTEKHFKDLENMSRTNESKSIELFNQYKDNLFACEFVNDAEAEMLYQTILNWKEKADMYDDLCD